MKQTTFNRCSLLIAIKDKTNVWRLRFRVVVTPNDGVLVFMLFKTLPFIDGKFEIPTEFTNNTIAVLGMVALEQSFYIEFNVHASENGFFSEHSNGYVGFIGVDISLTMDEWFIDSSLQTTNTQERIYKKFNETLYKVEPVPIGNFKAQRMSYSGDVM